jgi:hypothetical protein
MAIKATREMMLAAMNAGDMPDESNAWAAVHAVLEYVNEQIKEDYVSRWGWIWVPLGYHWSGTEDLLNNEEFLTMLKRSAANERAECMGGTIVPDEFEVIVINKETGTRAARWKLRRND